GMVLRTLMGDGPEPLIPEQTLTPEQVILAGVRVGDPSEFEYIERNGIRLRRVDEVEAVLDEIDGPVYVHIDLDVMEPTESGSICYPEAGGVAPRRLIDLVSRLDNIVGAALTEHAPEADNPAEADIIRRLGAALSGGGG